MNLVLETYSKDCVGNSTLIRSDPV